jgi:predicted nucleotidyltransferase
VYVRPQEWYLSIDLESKADTIERPAVGALDLSGWDIRKALRLFRKSNPPILEWLQSPTVYRDVGAFATELRARLTSFYSPRACAFHYWHMAQGNVRGYLQGDVVWRKKYLYVLRPLLALRWIAAARGPVPMEFRRLVDATIVEPDVKNAISALLAAKTAGSDLERGPRIATISEFIEHEMVRIEATVRSAPPPACAEDDLDLVFRRVLGEAWEKPAY